MEKNYNPDEYTLQDPAAAEEIGADELAVHTAGLTHPNDVELENILAEDWDSVPAQDNSAADADADAQTRYLPDTEQANYTPAAVEEPTQIVSVSDAESAEVTEDSDEADEEDYSEEDYSEEDSDEEVPVQKGRPKWKKGYGLLGIPHIISTAIWLAIIVAIGVSLGRILWVCCADLMSFGKPQVTAYVEVTGEDDIESIAQKLADANLIRYPGLFKTFAEITEKDERINLGVHELGSHLDYNAMINKMIYTGQGRQEVSITFPEGYNCAQFFKLLEDNGVCSVADLEEAAANGELKEYWFLEGVERGSKYCLEGYLSPDTYRFYTDDDPVRVLEKFLNEFDRRFNDIMKENLETMQSRYAKMLSKNGYGSDYINEHKLTLHQALTIASVIERETADDGETYDIASVFYNRITDPDIGTMGSDATVYYAHGDYFRDMGKLTEKDLKLDSPYNTRVSRGIPPGPICNPGAYSLYAALDPDETDYLYFIYDAANSKHLFSSSYDEHLRKAAELGE
jgi:UPF0755 protein